MTFVVEDCCEGHRFKHPHVVRIPVSLFFFQFEVEIGVVGGQDLGELLFVANSLFA